MRRAAPPRRGQFLPLALAIAAGYWHAAFAEPPGFKDDGAFFDAYLAAKRESPRSPVKALFESVWWAAQEDAAPPSLARADKHAESLLDRAVSYYAKGEYRLAEQALQGVEQASSESARLRLQLALRGYGALPAGTPLAVDEATAFNRVLGRLIEAQRAPAERRRQALSELDAIAANAAEPMRRDRARLWSALLLHDGGDTAAALRKISVIVDDSPLLLDATLAWLNIHPAPTVASLAAATLIIERRLPDSPALWEARVRLSEHLLSQSATAQAIEQVEAGIASAAEQVARLDATLIKLDQSPLSDWPSVLPLLPEDRRLSATTLIERRTRLQVERRLNAWLPYFFSYRGRLQNEGERFLAAIRAEVDTARTRQVASEGDAREALGLLRLDVEHLVGRPHDPGAAQRLIDGLARWETQTSAPERALAESVDFSDPRHSLAVTGELLAGFAARQSADAQSARALEKSIRMIAERNNAVMSEIRSISPNIDQALRNEILAGLRERRALAQQWINRLAHVALQAARAGQRLPQNAAPVRFVLDLAPPAPLLAGLEALPVHTTVAGARNADLATARAALRQTARAGETRPLRAEAQRLLAELTTTLAEGGATAHADEAIGAFEGLLKDYADLIVVADVRYRLARAQTIARRHNDAQNTLQKFESDHPGDNRLPEAALRIGDLQFAVGDYAAAGAAYSRAIAHGERLGRHELRDRADFMLGWTHFRLAQFRDAIPHFLALIDRKEQPGGTAPDPTLERENFRAIALTFSYLDGEHEIGRYFAAPERRKYLPDVYAGVAALHLERDRISDAARDHAALIAETPFHPRAAELLAGVVDGARRNGLARLALERMEEFVERYGHTGAFYQQAAPDPRRALDDKLKPYLVELSALYHADAQQSTADPARADASRRKALSYYDAFIDHPAHGGAPTSDLARQLFLRGEARTEASQYSDAIADYERAAYAIGEHAFAAEAGYAALVTRQKLLERISEGGERQAPLRALVRESERFAQHFSGDPRVAAVLLKAADDALLLNDPSTAAGLSEKLLARPRTTLEARRRAHVALGHARFDLGHYAGAEAAYAAALSGGRPDAGDANLRERLALSIYRQAESLRAAGQAEASASFLRAAAANPGGDTAAHAEIDAATLLLTSARWDAATTVLETFTGKRPQHPLIGKARLGLALAYENTGRLRQAADLLEALASEPRTDAALSAATLRRTGDLRLRDGDRNGARRAYVALIARSDVSPLSAAEIRHQLADLAGDDGDASTRRRYLEEILASRPPKAGEEGDGALRALIANAALRLGDLQAGEFAALPLRVPFEKSLPNKRRLLESALARYQDAVGQGLIDPTTEATFKSADLFQGLARAILDADVPAGLQALEREQYRLLLEEQSQPFEDKAVELHQINLQRMAGGLPGGQFNDWIRRSLRALQSLNPGRFERPEIVGPYFAYALPAAPPEPPPPARKSP